ncbi:hypothetical protein F5141DRAFT_1065257 [Pisolithus sp. B1]|nr:hypothetical protein F5141DRAFT_1065257 [Pisolithus sp. B1]
MAGTKVSLVSILCPQGSPHFFSLAYDHSWPIHTNWKQYQLLKQLTILPIGEEKDEGECMPLLHMQDEPSFLLTLSLTLPQLTAQRIMIMQWHYSALATTVIIPTKGSGVEISDSRFVSWLLSI